VKLRTIPLVITAMSYFVQKAELAAPGSFDFAAYCPGDVMKKCIEEASLRQLRSLYPNLHQGLEKASAPKPVRLEYNVQARKSLDGNGTQQTANVTKVYENFTKANNTALSGAMIKAKAENSTIPEDNVSECSTTDMLAESYENSSDSDTAEAQQLSQEHSGATSVPSEGSKEHFNGKCEPCGFFHHRGGCAKGTACTFCHLCPPGSIEQQRKQKRREARAKRQQAGANVIQVDAVVASVNASARHALMAAALANAAAGTLRTAAATLRTDLKEH